MPVTAEQATNTIRNPFSNIRETRDFACRNVWYVDFDMGRIMLFCCDPCDPDEKDPFAVYQDEVADLIKAFPSTNAVFTSETDEEGSLTLGVPTIELANDFAYATYKNLSTAGIRVVQTEDIESSDADRYLALLCDDVLAVAADQLGYLHDIIGHWLAVSVIEYREFEIFKTLCRDALQFFSAVDFVEFGKRYVAALAESFDRYSEDLLGRLAADNDPYAEDGYLLSYCVNHISIYFPEVFDRVTEQLQRFKVGEMVKNSNDNLVLLWDRRNLSNHYAAAAKQLKRAA